MQFPEHLSVSRSRSYRELPVVLGAEGEWEAGAIVREVTSSTGMYLFGTIRDVMLWVLSPPDRRNLAFAPGAVGLRLAELSRCGAPSELTQHLINLLRVCDGEISPAEVSAACLGVASWARVTGARQTELAFRQAAALAQPQDQALSIAIARLARDLYQHRRAETWFRRTIKLARSQRDWTTYVRAYLGLGTMYGRLGNGPAAKAVMERALRSATRWRLCQLAGEAHHDLFHVWADAGDLRRAYEHWRGAEVGYRGAETEFLARLAGDIATLWVRVGAARRAVPVFETVIPLTEDLGLRAVWTAQLVRCFAISQLRDSYNHLRTDAIAAISNAADSWRRAEATVILAWADLTIGSWDQAAAMAESALAIGTSIGATEVLSFAEQAFADAKAQRSEGARIDSLEPPALAPVADRIVGSIRDAVANRSTRARKELADAG